MASQKIVEAKATVVDEITEVEGAYLCPRCLKAMKK